MDREEPKIDDILYMTPERFRVYIDSMALRVQDKLTRELIRAECDSPVVAYKLITKGNDLKVRELTAEDIYIKDT
jgi:hypothetical protein